MSKYSASIEVENVLMEMYSRKPWYAHGIAEAILRTSNLSFPLKIYEIGGGSRTCAKGIMLNAPARVYENMSYMLSHLYLLSSFVKKYSVDCSSVEISSSLAKKQLETVAEVGSHLSKFKVESRELVMLLIVVDGVLDNLPHDLIYSENQVSPCQEVWVDKQPDMCSNICLGILSPRYLCVPVSMLF
ncbi:S-adenosyl-L-methionine-dependent methyltransferase MidA (mitochondrion) [Artemisia annua]|uniref:Protein arginine methyltransferase NDUFAF7 n=1 Tax=Artemisia annua TaxID=35608 RepID=A0A2U1PGR2_ARTAN|nr:S-adenosyl-L-methionine-dependent methyltransferase MidA [Artemisia annua]